MKHNITSRNWLRKAEEWCFTALMWLSVLTATVLLGLILFIVTWRGIGALSWEILTQVPTGAFYLGGEGGILNAITGSLALAMGATLLALLLAVPLVLYMHVYARSTRTSQLIRLSLDVMWGVPSIVYGAFGFSLMLYLGLRASLLAGIIALALVVLPILARTFDEVLSLTPRELSEVTFALGTTRLEVIGILLRQTIPGLVTAILLAFGRGIGDAAAVLFTAGYTNNMPESLFRPVASLPLAIFFQLGTPFATVQARAYAAALILTALILIISLGAQLSLTRLSRHVIR